MERVHYPHERVIVEAVTRMAGGLGLLSIAEGVEDGRIARTLADMGVDLLQGYHFSQAVTGTVSSGRTEAG